MEASGNMSLSTLLENEINSLPLERDDELTVITEDSLAKAGNSSMTRRGGKRDNGSSSNFGGSCSSFTHQHHNGSNAHNSMSSLGEMLDSMSHMDASPYQSGEQDSLFDAMTIGEDTVDSRQIHSAKLKNEPRRGKRSSKQNSHPKSPLPTSSDYCSMDVEDDDNEGGRRTRTIALNE